MQPDYASDNRLKKCRQIVKEIKPRYVNCPFGKPKIYRYSKGIARTKGWVDKISDDADEVLDHPFRKAALHLREQAEKAINLSFYWPKEMTNWLIRFVLPLEMAFEFGDHTPMLRDKMLSLDINPVAVKLLQKKRSIRLTIDTRRTRLIPRNARIK